MATTYRNPLPTVDIVIIMGDKFVLIKRQNPPHGFALPGGFVDEGESLAAAARRESLEETGLLLDSLEQFHTYSDPSRDPRRHTLSTVFIARSSGEPVAGDDAAKVLLASIDNPSVELLFDHGLILDDVRKYLATGVRPAHEK